MLRAPARRTGYPRRPRASAMLCRPSVLFPRLHGFQNNALQPSTYSGLESGLLPNSSMRRRRSPAGRGVKQADGFLPICGRERHTALREPDDGVVDVPEAGLRRAAAGCGRERSSTRSFRAAIRRSGARCVSPAWSRPNIAWRICAPARMREAAWEDRLTGK
jgi:hypothetical protein